MISNKVVSTLLAALAILTVACAVLLGFQTLPLALRDTAAALALRWICLGCVILLITDLVLLVGALSVRALERDQQGSDDS